MAQETKADRRAREVAEQAAAKALYLAGLPKRILDAQALAQSLEVGVRVYTDPGFGTCIAFTYGSYDDTSHLRVPSRDTDRAPVIEETLSYTSEEWEVEHLEGKLQELKKYNEDRGQRYLMATQVFARLTDPEKKAVKEFIYNLR